MSNESSDEILAELASLRARVSRLEGESLTGPSIDVLGSPPNPSALPADPGRVVVWAEPQSDGPSIRRFPVIGYTVNNYGQGFALIEDQGKVFEVGELPPGTWIVLDADNPFTDQALAHESDPYLLAHFAEQTAIYAGVRAS